MGISVVWEVDIQDDNENEKKYMTKRYMQRNWDKDLLDDYRSCEEVMMFKTRDTWRKHMVQLDFKYKESGMFEKQQNI